MSPSCKGRAFTLVEVLLALTLTAVVMTLVGRIAVQSLNLTNTIEQQRDQHHRHAYWLGRMERDMACVIDPSRTVTADLDAHGRPRIRIVALVPDFEVGDVAVQAPTEVTYRVLRNENHFRLARETRSLLRSQAVAEEQIVACDLQSIDVELWIDGPWHPIANRSGNRQPKPEGLRVTVEWPDEDTQQRTWQLGDNADWRRQSRGR